ncbi:hypothetical protein HCA55_11920 [Listeria booriae]|uniref:Uncharacterized protein n=1 Tax=Listeria booriae TaxID=1552123 RepID=A0A842B0I7_9LIST|nr:hypothetical protein [Listeria booriae]MBC1797436.1 hypothetical protein [Listeria booriae]MBC1812018.1 hypothetical protein [Listeria booriae]
MSSNLIFFTKKQSNKLLYSEHLKNKDFQWLYDLLEKDKHLTTARIPANKLTMLSEMQDTLLNKSMDEWIQHKSPNGQHIEDRGEDEGKWMHCSLCNKKNRYIYYIKNTVNSVTLNVGSDCITEFGSLAAGAQSGKRMLQNNARRARNLQKLLTVIPGARKRISDWSKFVSDLAIIPPFTVTKEYEELGNAAELLYEKILNNNKNDDYIKNLQLLFNSADSIQTDILEYINKNKNRKFILTKEQAYWIRTNQTEHYTQILELVRKSKYGLISLQSAKLIRDSHFLNTFMITYNTKIMQLNDDIWHTQELARNKYISSGNVQYENEYPEITDTTNGTFTYKFRSLTNIVFKISSTKFISLLGFIVFNSTINHNNSILRLIMDSSIPDVQSCEALFYQIQLIFDGKIIFNEFQPAFQYVDFAFLVKSSLDTSGVKHYTHIYKRYNSNDFISKMSTVIFRKNKDALKKYLDAECLNTYSESEYNSAREFDRDLDIARRNTFTS